MSPVDDDDDDDDLADFAASLRAQLAPVTTSPDRAAAIRTRAHAELRRASEPPAVRARRHVVFVLETSSALAAGATYVLWTISQLYRR